MKAEFGVGRKHNTFEEVLKAMNDGNCEMELYFLNSRSGDHPVEDLKNFGNLETVGTSWIEGFDILTK